MTIIKKLLAPVASEGESSLVRNTFFGIAILSYILTALSGVGLVTAIVLRLVMGGYNTLLGATMLGIVVFGFTHVATSTMIKDIFGPGDGLTKSERHFIQSLCQKLGLETEVQVITDLGSVLAADEDHITVTWYDGSDGVVEERFFIRDARKIGIRGGDEVRMRRVYHNYLGLPMVMESIKLVFSNSSSSEFHAEHFDDHFKPHVYGGRDKIFAARLADLK